MALDFDALRKKLNSLQGQNNRSTAIWKPTAGKSVIRILPWKENADIPFIELYFHYLGGKTQLSPLTRGKPDPIAEFADKLGSTGSKDDWAQAKNFRPKLRTFAPVIVRGEEEKGVRFWGFGQTVYKKLLTVIADPDWGDITHPETGRDVTIEFTPKKNSDTNFDKTEVMVKPNQSPVTANAEQLQKYLTTQPDIYEVFSMPTYEELSSFLEKYLDPDSDKSVTAAAKAPAPSTESVVEEAPAPAAPTAPTAVAVGPVPTEDVKNKSKGDVADEFDALFNS